MLSELEVPRSDAGLDKDSSNSKRSTAPTTLPFTPEKAQAPASNGFHYSPGFLATSNLSQLAELAANKSAMNQTPQNSVQQPMQPHILGGQSRFVIPSQGLPPGMFGAYPSGTMVQYTGFPSAPPTQVPSPFVKGSIIQLTSGDLKRVEDLTTEDFIHSTKLYPDHKLDTSTVVKIEDGADAGCTHITFTINSSKKQARYMIVLMKIISSKRSTFIYRGKGQGGGGMEYSGRFRVGRCCPGLQMSSPF